MSKGIANSLKKLKEAAEKHAKGELEVEVATPKKNGGGRKRKGADGDAGANGDAKNGESPAKKRAALRMKVVMKKEVDEESSGPGLFCCLLFFLRWCLRG